MAVYFVLTCGACGERVVTASKGKHYVHVSERYGAVASDHDVTTVVSTKTEEQAA